MSQITIVYLPSFVKGFRKLEKSLQAEVVQKTRSFENRAHHKQLEVHKLQGKLAGRWSFSVTQKYRIVFIWEDKQTAVFLAIGDHDIYR